jgi:hypothetical protein
MAYDNSKKEKPDKTKKMTEGDLRASLKGLIDDSIEFATEELGPDRAKATEYYRAKLFGNEEEGRSQFVMSEVRDTVLGMIPGLLRVIFGPEHVVEYAPRNAAQVAAAEQATDYARWVFEEDNAGLMKTYSVLVDGLVRRLGIFKWGVDDTSTVKAMKGHAKHSEIEQLLQDPGFELQRVTQTQPAVQQSALVGPGGQPMQAAEPQEAEYDIEFTYTENGKRIWIEAVPDDEFIYNREARDIESAILVGHKMRKSESDLVALGIDEDVIEEHGGDDTSILDTSEAQARLAEGQSGGMDPDAGEANEKHLYIESYVKIDFDGDGIAELRKICTLGPGYHIVENEPVASRPFSIFTPIPEPHTMLGQSIADLTMDIQLLKSSMIRSIQDSAAASIFPRIGYVEGHVSVADVMNTAIGGPIRMRQQGDLQPISIPFLGVEMLPLVQYIDDVKENRTGQAKGPVGLDADALQSTEKAAAGAVISATQAREEVLARIFAEQALKPMFRGILELIGEIKPKKQMIKMRGAWTEVDPEQWDLNLGVSVNVMLGTSAKEQKIAALQSFADKQELIITTLGPQNPIASLSQYANTLRKAAKLLGFPDVDSFFGQVPEGWAPPPKPEQPDPKMAKVQADAQLGAQRLQLDAQRMQHESEMKKIDAKIAEERLKLDIEKMRQEGLLKTADMRLRHEDAVASNATAVEKIASDQALAIKNMELTHQVKISETEFQATVELAKHKAKIEAENVQTAAKIASEQKIAELRAGLEHERSLVEAHHKHIENMQPEPEPVDKGTAPVPQPVKIDIHHS